MHQRTIDEMRRRTCPGWTYYLWAVTLTIGAAVLAYVTFRPGLAAIVADPSTFLSLLICMASLIVFWRGRPRRRKPERSTRLTLQ